MDLYSYTGNDPVNRTDPTGLIGCTSSDGTHYSSCTITVTYDKKTSQGTLTVTGKNKKDKESTTLFKGGVTVGGKGHETPTGNFTASYWEKDHTSKLYGDTTNVPWSKTKLGGNAFGPYQLHIKELDKRGIYIHGTMGPGWINTRKISGYALSETSHGCVRMGNRDNIEFHEMMPDPKGNAINIQAQDGDDDE